MSFFKKPQESNRNSKFWLDIDSMSNKAYDVLTGKKQQSSDFVKMISIRNSISNFVRIVTGKNIPVKYSSGNQSYTDGKTVVISAKVENDNFDPTVGLALHEASHILLTDFSTLPELMSSPPAELVKRVIAERKLDVTAAREYVISNLKQLINIIEDRRIDNYIFTNAPGYKGYYHALYEKYFNDPIIDKGLLSPEFRLETWNSYLFRVGNITNKNRDLKALKGLQQIWDLIDIKNIDRLKTTREVVALSTEVFNIIEDNVNNADVQQEEEERSKSQSEKSKERAKSKSSKDELENLDPSGEDDSDNQEDSEGPEADGKELDNKEMDKLKEAIDKQTKFLTGKVDKDQLSDNDAEKMEAIEKAEAKYEHVAKDISASRVDGCRVLVAKKLTKALIVSRVFSSTLSANGSRAHQEAVLKGMNMGAMLGKKLQIRQEARDTKFTRQNIGKIDRRLIASISTGLENIFEQTFVTKFNPSIIHISVDASGSMDGDRFEKAITCAVAIAKACSMIENMDCVISFRATEVSGRDAVPSVLIAYDSRIDSINKITSLFCHLQATSSTPEGLCFEAIMKLLPAGGATINSYFVNFSDGEPGFSNRLISYSGDIAHEHTRKQITKMRDKGIKVLSYFIGKASSNGRHDAFTQMYGKDAKYIDTDSVPLVAKTMNAKFLEA